MFCHRGIYDTGWAAVTRELYDTSTDWSQAHNLAAEMPEKLEELKMLCMEEARKYNVLPLDDRRAERFNFDIAGRPTLITGNSQLLFGSMGRLTENVVINAKNKSHSVTADPSSRFPKIELRA
jgi:hypothetical protein